MGKKNHKGIKEEKGEIMEKWNKEEIAFESVEEIQQAIEEAKRGGKIGASGCGESIFFGSDSDKAWVCEECGEYELESSVLDGDDGAVCEDCGGKRVLVGDRCPACGDEAEICFEWLSLEQSDVAILEEMIKDY